MRRGIELLYFGYSDLIGEADTRLAETPYGRAHHRALYFIARSPGLSVGELLGFLRVTKQSLSRILKDLQEGGLVEVRVGQRDRRQRLLMLTGAGLQLEQELFELLRTRMASAYAAAGQEAVSGFWQVLAALLPDDRREAVLAMQRRQEGSPRR